MKRLFNVLLVSVFCFASSYAFASGGDKEPNSGSYSSGHKAIIDSVKKTDAVELKKEADIKEHKKITS